MAHKPDSYKPLGERNLRAAKDGPGGDRELVAAIAAVPAPVLGHPEGVLCPTARASDAVGPAQAFKVGFALALGGESPPHFFQGFHFSRVYV